MKNTARYEINEDGKYDIYYHGFDYTTFSPTAIEKLIRTVDTEDEAKKVCSDCVDFGE